MKYFYLVLFNTLLISLAWSDWTAEVVDNTTTVPHRYTGVVGPRAIGSGVVVNNERAGITAAHVMYNENSEFWYSGMEFKIRNEGEYVPIPGYRHLVSYASLVRTEGVNAPATFNQDFVAFYAYESLSGSPTDVAEVAENPVGLLTGTANKLMTGFPGGLYDSPDPRQGQMHETGPFTLRFYQENNDYYKSGSVSTGPGASGGGVWVQTAGGWKLAGIIVSGLEKSLGDMVNISGVVALTGEKQDLLDECIVFINTLGPPVIVVEAPQTVSGSWYENTDISLEFESNIYVSPPVIEYRDPRDPTNTYHEVPWQEWDPGYLNVEVVDGIATFQIPNESLLYDNKVFRVKISNYFGQVTSQDILFQYANHVPATITNQPENLYLSGGVPAILSAETEGFPPPDFQWELKMPGWTEFKPVSNYSWQKVEYYEDESGILHLEPNSGFFHESFFRLKIEDGYDVLYTNPNQVNYTDLLDSNIVVLDSPPNLISWGDSFDIQVENTTSMGGSFGWVVTDPFGNEVKDFPPISYISEYPFNRISIQNLSGPLHGYTISTWFRGKYYVSDDIYRVLEYVDYDGPSWTIRADAPPALQDDLLLDYNSSNDAEISLSWSALNPPVIDWQISLDNGIHWQPYTTTTGTPLILEENEFGVASPLIRARLEMPDQSVFTSNYMTIPGRGIVNLERSDVEVINTQMNIGHLDILEDSLLAYSEANLNGSDRIIIYERNESGWFKSAEITPDTWFSFDSRLKFIDENHLLFSNNSYATDGESESGIMYEFERNQDNSWSVRNTIKSTQVAYRANFGMAYDYDDETLAVMETNYGSNSCVHVFSRQNDTFQHVQKLVLDAQFGDTTNGWDVQIRGNWIQVSTSRTVFYFQKSRHNVWELTDGDGGRSGVISLSFLGYEGNSTLYDHVHWHDMPKLSLWEADSNGDWNETLSVDCPLGKSEISDNPLFWDTNRQTNGIITEVPFTTPETDYGLLFQLESGNRYSTRAVYISESEQLSGISLSSKLAAFFLCKDVWQNWSEDSWEIWIVPLEKVKPVALPFPTIQTFSQFTSNTQLSSHFTIQYRESLHPGIVTKVQSSTDCLSWNDLDSNLYEKIILNEDIDGDDKTALVELRIQLLPAQGDLFLRIIEE